MTAIDPKLLGERLRKARENAKLTQAEAAQAATMARTTIVAIEQGLATGSHGRAAGFRKAL